MSDVTNFDNLRSPVGCEQAAPRRMGLYAMIGKRLLDILLALILFPVLSPVIALLWMISRRDGGPGFFGHTRIGKDGTPFTCWKIRTMIHGAEDVLAEHLKTDAKAAREWARDRKLSRDPRITNLGLFLRRSSLDELPQIWNVLRGDMSFVGPRPIVRCELSKYGSAAPIYLSQKPGITGLWQVSGRNDVSYEDRVSFDIDYLERRTFSFDIKLILLTGLSVIGRTGR
ncbi:sugar transferase [Phaeobacter inhibens]|uniref:Sugar transferase n=1 Tax=Phaeobacter inhibens TaxID=221822 RepID=A0A2I7KEX2_9RHOB|nr:sugar transferase [Phaeobacter inhibens]AUR01101.1 sugar transferase [Phaeobacter inhibens]UWR43235.1 sugar transferase [Phaeobacter inhibens]UWR47184.1 sugar transferase [Phaeobacter inhibens]UWR78441.1 sugar transferase [Phaeobacter inhibens]UWR82173.1 sugar transferase [Phaeobacter inhibens]